MFIKDTWYIAAWSDEVGPQLLARTVCGEPLVLFRDQGGKLGALADRCCHRGAPLHFGEVVEAGLQCGYHGLTFDVTGRCVHIPGQEQIPDKARVRAYPVVEKDAFVWVWLGDPERADPAAIVDYPFHNDTAHWPHKHDVYHVKCNHMLLVDNLMDLTHVGFVHKTTIGGNPQVHVHADMKVTPEEGGLHFIRWMRDCLPPPSYLKAMPFEGHVDRWQEFRYIAPGSILQWTGAMDVGRNAEQNREQPGNLSFRIFHGVTPETENTSFYFWSVANGYRQDDPQATQTLFQEIGRAFNEDKAILEGQQETLDRTGEAGLVDIVSDRARGHMRRVVKRLLEKEAAHPG